MINQEIELLKKPSITTNEKEWKNIVEKSVPMSKGSKRTAKKVEKDNKKTKKRAKQR